jgi:hypothetical protein
MWPTEKDHPLPPADYLGAPPWQLDHVATLDVKRLRTYETLALASYSVSTGGYRMRVATTQASF